jgi:hypothetical protein
MKLTKEEIGLLYLIVAEANKHIDFNTYCKDQLNQLLVKLDKEAKSGMSKL